MERLRESKTVWFLISTAILGALIYVSDYREILKTFAEANVLYASIAIVFGCFTFLMWSVVWHRFFEILEMSMSYFESLRTLLAGFFLNALTPMGRFGGEPFIAHMIASRTEATYQQALSSVSSADLSNAIPFVSFGALSISYMAIFYTLEGVIATVALIFVIVVMLFVLVVYLFWFNGARHIVSYAGDSISFGSAFERWDEYIESGKERGKEVLNRLQGVGEQPKKVLLTVMISHLAVSGHVGATYFSFLAVGIQPDLVIVFMIVSLSAFLTFSPTPGSAGTLEAGLTILILAFYPGLSNATATSIAILYRISTYLPGVVLGYASFVTLKDEIEIE